MRKVFPFMRETFWILSALYFRPTMLKQHSFDSMVELDQEVAQYYFAQMTTLCFLAATPFLVLAPLAPQPPGLFILLFSFLLCGLAGVGAAVWQDALGPMVALGLALLAGVSDAPGKWLTSLLSVELLTQPYFVEQSWLTGTITASILGIGWGWLIRIIPIRLRSFANILILGTVVYFIGVVTAIATAIAAIIVRLIIVDIESRIFTFPFVIAFYLAGYIVNLMSYHVASNTVSFVILIMRFYMMFTVVFIVVFVIATYVASIVLLITIGVKADLMRIDVGDDIAVILAFSIVLTMTSSLLSGLVFSVIIVWLMPFATIFANIIISSVFVGIIVGLALGTKWATTFNVDFNKPLLSVVIGTSAGLLLIIGSILATFVAVNFVNLPNIHPAMLFLVVAIIGWGLGTWRWQLSELGVIVFIFGGLMLILMPNQLFLIAVCLLTWATGFFHIPILLFHSSWIAINYVLCRWTGQASLQVLADAPWHWDELITLPLPLLEPLLVQAAHKDRQAGLIYIAEAAATWRQGGPARRALVRLAADDLAQCTNERTIAGATDALRWLPETLPRTVADTLGRFRTVSRMVDDKLITTDPEAQLTKLSAATAELDSMLQGFSFVPARERALFLPIAQAWREVLKRATGRLPNPYVAGDPLRTGSSGLFVGRADVLRQLEMHLRDRSQRPALLLFGQRRMGKSSLLYQLPNQLGDGVVPVRVDCQALEMRDGNTAFLFHLARAIQAQAAEQRSLNLPSPPALGDTNSTSFMLWLEQVEAALESRLLLLGLDEFEALGDAIENKWLDERVLGFLRNLIQHHPKLNILLAGSHRPQELARFWSSYLISVNVFEISYLEPLETRRLIERPIPGFGLHYQPQAVDHIIALTRCQPLLVQLLCQELVHLLNDRGEREAGVAEVEAAVPRALERGNTLYFNYLREYDAGLEGNVMLTKLAKRGQSAVIKTAELTGDQPAYVAALQRLLARDLVEEVEGGIRFEVELVRRWWAQQA